MARLTRAQSQAQTRARLMESARTLFAAHGVGATSVEQIAEHAGYSRGAFYGQFASKDALALELLRMDAVDLFDPVVAALRRATAIGPEPTIAVWRAVAEAPFDLDRDRLRQELILHGSRVPEIGAALRAQMLRNHARLAEMMREMFATLRRVPPIDPAEIARLLLIFHHGRKVHDIAAVAHDAGGLAEMLFRLLLAVPDPAAGAPDNTRPPARRAARRVEDVPG